MTNSTQLQNAVLGSQRAGLLLTFGISLTGRFPTLLSLLLRCTRLLHTPPQAQTAQQGQHRQQTQPQAQVPGSSIHTPMLAGLGWRHETQNL